MSRENSGYQVITKSGWTGRTYHRVGPVNGKVVVFLIDEDFNPVLDEKGQQKKLLCDPATLKIVGFID